MVICRNLIPNTINPIIRCFCINIMTNKIKSKIIRTDNIEYYYKYLHYYNGLISVEIMIRCQYCKIKLYNRNDETKYIQML